MNCDDRSRRALLQALATILGAAALPCDVAQMLQAAEHTHAIASPGGSAVLAFFTAQEAADVEAVAAQIIPSDDTPGSREAGVVSFMDRALATFFARLAPDYRRALAAFQAGYRLRIRSRISRQSRTPPSSPPRAC